MTLRQTDAYSAGCKWKGMAVYGQPFTTMQGCVRFRNSMEWNGMVPFQRNGMVTFLFGWEKWRAEEIEVKLTICLKIVINNDK